MMGEEHICGGGGEDGQVYSKRNYWFSFYFVWVKLFCSWQWHGLDNISNTGEDGNMDRG